MLQAILGSFGAFLIFNNPVYRKREVLERNIHLNLCYPVLCGHCLPSRQAEYQSRVPSTVKQSIKAPGLLNFTFQCPFKASESVPCSRLWFTDSNSRRMRGKACARALLNQWVMMSRNTGGLSQMKLRKGKYMPHTPT